MLRRLPLLAVLPLALALSGCFQVFSTLTVRSDGSAQIVERITAEGAMAMGLMAMGDREGDGPSSFERRAASLGAGVTLASVDEAYAPGQITYTVTYDVADVGALEYTASDAIDPESVGESMMGGMASGEDLEGLDAEEDAGEPFRFAFEPAAGDRPATLRVTVPDDASPAGDLDFDQMSAPDTDEDGYKQALVLLGTMEMRFDVVVEGELVEADRGWADGNRVTLSAIQMGELLTYARDEIADGDVGAFLERQDPTADADLPGLRYAAPGEVTLRFR